MKRVLFALALLGMAVGGANADENDLFGGALITHYSPDYICSDDPCGEFFIYGPITHCQEQVTEIMTPDFLEVCWYVVAAFGENKIWCGVQFGFDDYDARIMYFLGADPCYPPDGGLEIKSPGWPGPLEGTAIVSTGAPWDGNWLPVYAFKAYAYGYYGSGIVQLIPDPTVAIPFGGMGNCASPPEKWDSALGGMGVNDPGTWVCWEVEEGACCFGPICEMREMQDCIDSGGDWVGGPCEPNPCEPPPEGACCFDQTSECLVLTEEVCAEYDGRWLGPDTVCEPNPCEGACCECQDCHIMLEDDCIAQGWEWVGGPCDPNPCEDNPPSPAAPTSWGTIKSLYR